MKRFEDIISVASTIFELADIAHEEIKNCVDPVKADAAFPLIIPPHGLIGRVPEVYRAHARELIERYLEGGDTRLGTKAEVMVALSEASLKAPLNQAGMAVYETLFAEIFPGKILDARTPETHRGQVAEDLEDARRKMAVNARKL